MLDARNRRSVSSSVLVAKVSLVSMNGDALDGVARGRGVTLVDETCEEREWERNGWELQWRDRLGTCPNAFFYQNVASCERAKKKINPLVLSAAARHRAAD